MEMNYCSNCGDKLEIRLIDEVERHSCPSCSFVHWSNFSVSVGALVVKEDKLLLVRRSQNPGKGKWTNPGGFVEQTELIEQAVIREVQEETGIKAKVKSIVTLGDFPGRVHNVYITFLLEYVEGEPQPDEEEVDGAGFFSLKEMESMNVADLTWGLAKIAFEADSDGLSLNRLDKTAFNGYTLFNI
ncbi:NUDIX domain-containing protein [Salinicoccus sp. HZC-1]|uniref:NUDIX domain-containing protein n=1 Tax=Salinicoccus sp. HZC-1 TaxID=3385497 RepID=UPI00398B8A72